MTAAKTYLKIPFAGRTLRSLPAEERHSIALVMSRGLPSTAKKLGVMLDVIQSLIGDSEYERIITDLTSGKAAASDVVNLLSAIVTATDAHQSSHAAAEGTPE
jgi:hypothetical protein